MKQNLKVQEIGDPSLDYLFEPESDNTNHPSYNKLMENIHLPEVGKIVNATLEKVTNHHYLLNYNTKDYIYVDKTKVESIFLNNIENGSEVNLLITEINEKPFLIKGSVARIYDTATQKENSDVDIEDMPVEVLVKEITGGGFNLDMTLNNVTVKAFMPNTLAGVNKVLEPEKMLGQTLMVMIESFSLERGTYIVSRKKYLLINKKEELKNLEFGKVYTGRVTGTAPFGVFVEFNTCLTGMIHISNLNEAFRDQIMDIPAGMEIDFYVKDKNTDRVNLTQYLSDTESIWDTAKENDIYEARVIDQKKMGLLVSLDSETKGMVPIADIIKSNKNYKSGDTVKVRITAISRDERKIFLTLN